VYPSVWQIGHSLVIGAFSVEFLFDGFPNVFTPVVCYAVKFVGDVLGKVGFDPD
jgi:hypothetical protein